MIIIIIINHLIKIIKKVYNNKENSGSLIIDPFQIDFPWLECSRPFLWPLYEQEHRQQLKNILFKLKVSPLLPIFEWLFKENIKNLLYCSY